MTFRAAAGGSAAISIALALSLTAGCAAWREPATLISDAGHYAVAEAECEVPVATAGESQIDGDRISLLSWNVHKGYDAAWRDDLERLVAPTSILAIQEAAVAHDDNHGFPVDEGVHWSMVEAFAINGRHAGPLLAAPATPVKTCAGRHAEPLIRLPKGTLVQFYPLADYDEMLLVVNLHSINFTIGTRAYEEQMSAALAPVANHTGPVILAGDLNTWSGPRLQLAMSLTEAVGLQHVDFGAPGPRRHFGQVLDHVFYRGLELTSARAVPVSSSDHDPLLAEFRLPTRTL
jgi:endonuclease/exonuclease/phosphatase (EEP) superfamily protein YafD